MLALALAASAALGAAVCQPPASRCGSLAAEEAVALIQTQVQVDRGYWTEVGQQLAHLLKEAAEAQPDNDLVGDAERAIPQSAQAMKDKVEGMSTDFWLTLVIVIESTILLLTMGIPFVIWLMAYILGRIIKGAIETFDRLIIGTDVTIQDLRTNVFNGVVSIEGLEVHNPGDGKYNSKYLLKAGLVHIDLDMCALFCSFFRHFKVEKIEFKNVDVIVEKGKGSSNVQDVINFLQGSKGGKGDSKDAKADKSADDSSKSKTQVTLHEVAVEDVGARVEAQVLGGRGMRVSVGDIRYNDFAEEVGESTVGPIVQVLLKSVLKTVAVNIVGKQLGEYLL